MRSTSGQVENCESAFMTFTEIGAELGISPQSARMIAHRALEKLKQQMMTRGVSLDDFLLSDASSCESLSDFFETEDSVCQTFEN